jgi:hypothetical protein
LDGITYSFLALFCMAVGALPLWAVPLLWKASQITSAPHGLAWIWQYPAVSLSVLGVLATLHLAFTRRQSRWTAAFFTATLLGLFVTQSSLASGWFMKTTDLDNKEGFRIVLAADAWANSLNTKRDVLWWYDKQEPRQGIIYGITSLFMRSGGMVNDALPQLTEAELNRMSAVSVIALSWRPGALDRINQTLNRYGFSAKSEHKTEIQDKPATLFLEMFHIRRSDSDVEHFITQRGLTEFSDVYRPNDFRPAMSSVSLDGDASIRIRFTAPPWAYAAKLPVNLQTPGDQVWIRLRAKVNRGEISFGVTDSTGQFEDRIFVKPDDQFQDILLTLLHPDAPYTLIVGNGKLADSSDVVVEQLTLIAKRASLLGNELEKHRPHRIEPAVR